MRRNADLVDDVGNDALERGVVRLRLRRDRCGASCSGDGQRLFARLRALPQTLYQLRRVARLGEEVCRAELRALGNDMCVDKPGKYDHRRRGVLLGELAQHAQSVQPRLHQLQQHNVRVQRFDLGKRIRTVGGCPRRFHIPLL